MRRCEDEKMRYRRPLLEEPCAQTLSGKNIDEKQWLLMIIYNWLSPGTAEITTDTKVRLTPSILHRQGALTQFGNCFIHATVCKFYRLSPRRDFVWNFLRFLPVLGQWRVRFPCPTQRLAQAAAHRKNASNAQRGPFSFKSRWLGNARKWDLSGQHR